MNARSSDPTTPFIDIVERTGITNYYDLDMKVRLGDLSGLTSTQLLGQTPATAGFGLFSENVYLTGGISATYGDIGGWTIDANTIASTRIVLDNLHEQISVGTTNQIRISGSDTAPYISIAQDFPSVFSGTGLWMGIQDDVARMSFVNDQGSLLLSPEGLHLTNLTIAPLASGDEILNLINGHVVTSGNFGAATPEERPMWIFKDTNFNHGMTDLLDRQEWLRVQSKGGEFGGVFFQCVADNGVFGNVAWDVQATAGTPPAATSINGVTMFSSTKIVGATLGALADDDNAFVFRNSVTPLLTMKGDGSSRIHGQLKADSTVSGTNIHGSPVNWGFMKPASQTADGYCERHGVANLHWPTTRKGRITELATYNSDLAQGGSDSDSVDFDAGDRISVFADWNGSNAWALTVRKNGVDTALSVTLGSVPTPESTSDSIFVTVEMLLD